jgi:hypothetical protein
LYIQIPSDIAVNGVVIPTFTRPRIASDAESNRINAFITIIEFARILTVGKIDCSDTIPPVFVYVIALRGPTLAAVPAPTEPLVVFTNCDSQVATDTDVSTSSDQLLSLFAAGTPL